MHSSPPIAFNRASLRFLDRLLPNVNVVPSRFLFLSCLPYPNGSCNKIGFDIELQINAIGIGWFLLPLPPKNRTCEFPCIRLKWLRFEDASTRNPLSETGLEVRASGERNESFALGKRFAVAKLTASLSPRAKLRPRLLFCHTRSKSAPAKIP